MEDVVIEFIKRRFTIDANWCNGNCYWFAHILFARFQQQHPEICYLPVSGHFVVRIEDKYYDWTGRVNIDEPVYTFEQLKQDEPHWYNRIVQDCIL